MSSLAYSQTLPTTEDHVECFFDGACPGNQFDQKGQMRAAFVIGLKSFIRDVPDLATPDGPLRSNNIAEYQGADYVPRTLARGRQTKRRSR